MGQGKIKYEINMTKEYLTKESHNIGASLVAQTVKNLPAVQETWVRSLGSGRSPREGNGYPLRYSCLENPMDRGAWQEEPYSP